MTDQQAKQMVEIIMSTIDDGGPAFPFKCQGPTTAPEIYYGMSFRDYLAAAALQGILASSSRGSDTRGAVRDAYDYADEALRVRREPME